MLKTYIVTGGAGFIGSHLAKRLVSAGSEVHVLDDLSNGYESNVPKGAVFHKVDIGDDRSILRLKLPKKIDCIFHMAAQSSGEASFADPARDMDINYKATYYMLKLAEAKKCRRFLFTSSMSVYGEVPDKDKALPESYPCRPWSYYGCNKLASESIIRLFAERAGINYTIFRPFNVYGPGQNMRNMKQGMVSIYLAYLMKNRPITVKGSLSRFRDFIYIDDVIEALMRCIADDRTYGEIFNLGTSVKTTVGELLHVILAAWGKKDFNKWVIVRGCTAGDVSGLRADISKIRRVLDWRPVVKLDSGIPQMKEWLDAAV